jgi:Leucine-rich repeat (LRR) protein
MTTQITSINISSNNLVISYSKGSPDKNALTQVLEGLNYYETYVNGCKSEAFQPGSTCTDNQQNTVIINKSGMVTHINISEQKGFISTELGQLKDLTNLILSNNQLTGNIPTELGQLKDLTNLILSNNQLTGNIPTELGLLKGLNYLQLNNNQLKGNIPTELGLLKGLNLLELDSNCLTITKAGAKEIKTLPVYLKSTIYLNSNCIPKDEYGLKGISTQNCTICNGCNKGCP